MINFVTLPVFLFVFLFFNHLRPIYPLITFFISLYFTFSFFLVFFPSLCCTSLSLPLHIFRFIFLSTILSSFFPSSFPSLNQENLNHHIPSQKKLLHPIQYLPIPIPICIVIPTHCVPFTISLPNTIHNSNTSH